MSTNQPPTDAPAGEDLIKRVGEVRLAMLHLHKTLLDAERLRYERVNGRIDAPQIFLQVVLHNPWFGWLRPLSGLIVEIDEWLDAELPLTRARGAALLEQVRLLLRPEEGGEVFAENYFAALQESPDVVIAHRGVTRLLGTPG